MNSQHGSNCLRKTYAIKRFVILPFWSAAPVGPEVHGSNAYTEMWMEDTNMTMRWGEDALANLEYKNEEAGLGSESLDLSEYLTF
ncbi:hypothetical protein HF325_004135 [Metschnikowia pulcherrima]|uniref:Uncharacterized protein n=1 Tax=Metschnikowia pulcherrima TaxID=27326 RepID=A0A8H7LAW2_9ASCO|nr:hypothetical protein HF325_004135 [Metschnikowia pulcherrima]